LEEENPVNRTYGGGGVFLRGGAWKGEQWKGPQGNSEEREGGWEEKLKQRKKEKSEEHGKGIRNTHLRKEEDAKKKGVEKGSFRARRG